MLTSPAASAIDVISLTLQLPPAHTMKRTAISVRSLLAMTSLAAILAISPGCEDPSVAQQEQAAIRIRQGGDQVAQAARLASLDRIAAAAELRAAGAKLTNIAGANDAQKQSAAGITANATTQAALLELGRINQLESTNRSSRMLASSLLRVVDDIHAIVKAEDVKGVASVKTALQPELDSASKQKNKTASVESTLTDQISTLRAENESALASAQALLAEAEEIRLRGLSAESGEITNLAQEAGRKRDEARVFETQANQSESLVAIEESILRLRAQESIGATNRVKAFQDALAALEKLSAAQESAATQYNAISTALQASIMELVNASDPDSALDLKGCYERAFADLETADAAARRAAPKSSSLFSIAAARARAFLLRGDGEFQQAQILHELSLSPTMSQSSNGLDGKANEWLAKARASTKEALDAYTTLQEVLATSGVESPSKQALISTVERALKTIQQPSFEIPLAPPALVRDAAVAPIAVEKPAQTNDAPVSPTQSGKPPFASAEALRAFMGSSNRDPAVMAHIDDLLIATSPEAEALATTVFGAMKAIGQLQVAMQNKFGSSKLGMLDSLVNRKNEVTVADVTDENATLIMGGMQGSLSFKIKRTDDGWKFDLDSSAAEMDSAMQAQMTAAGAMMGTLTKGLGGITERIESGEIKSAQQAQGALMMAMQKLMGGMSRDQPGPGGGPGGSGSNDEPTEN